jgi:hypothetical protein
MMVTSSFCFVSLLVLACVSSFASQAFGAKIVVLCPIVDIASGDDDPCLDNIVAPLDRALEPVTKPFAPVLDPIMNGYDLIICGIETVFGSECAGESTLDRLARGELDVTLLALQAAEDPGAVIEKVEAQQEAAERSGLCPIFPNAPGC